MFNFLHKYNYCEEVQQDGAASGSGAEIDSNSDDGGLLGNTPSEDNWLPEKFVVKGGDGELDISLSAKKLAEGYTNLEKLVGTGEKPPKTPEEYDLKLGDGVQFDAAAFEEMKKDPEMQSFLKGAHAKGLTNEQVNYVLSEYLPRAQTLADGAHQLDLQSAQSELTELWGERDFAQNIERATAAFKAFVPEKYQSRISDMRDPVLVAILANVGKELGEDSPANNAVTQAITEDVESLMRSEAYFNESHPDHKSVKAKVQNFYQRKYGNKPA